MRRFLSLFMMLLLALRGLAGDAMAMENPVAHSPAHIVMVQAAVMATTAMHMSHDMDHSNAHVHHDIAGHVEHQGHAVMDSAQCSATEPSSCDSHDGSHCTTCGLCHTAMGQAQSAVFAGTVPTSRKAPYGADRFASVAPAAQIKPPISAV